MSGGRIRGAILVTGAAGGIGLSTARALVAVGRDVVGVDIDSGALADVGKALGPTFRAETIDVADAAGATALVMRIADRHGLSGFVHSAALFPQGSFSATDLELWDRVMAVNLRAAFTLARAGEAAMREGGSMVFLTSGAGSIDAAADSFQRQFLAYGVSKAALDRLVAGIAVDLAPAGIAANAISPGAFVETPGTARVDLGDARDIARIDVARVGRAVAWLAESPRMGLSGRRLAATGFGGDWGDDDALSPGARPFQQESR